MKLDSIVHLLIIVSLLCTLWEVFRLKQKMRNLERQLKDFDVIPKTFGASEEL